MSGLDYVTLLGDNFNEGAGLPSNVEVLIVDSLTELERTAAKIHTPGNHAMFGTAFLQGERLNFTTAVPWGLMLALGVVEQSEKGAAIEEVLAKSNRPKQSAHGAHLRRYLKETACQHQKFITPSITMNCGASFGGEAIPAKVTLIIVANASKTVEHGSTAWSAMLIVPSHIRLHVTDGGHRVNQSRAIVDDGDKEVTEAMKAALLSNAIDVRVIFEVDSEAAHQDFADCGKSKPIAASLITAYDRRDQLNLFTSNLVRGSEFLREHVDATAAGVNLSGRSIKCWPMSAVRMTVDTINRLARERTQSEAPFTEGRFTGLPEFIDHLRDKVPTLATIWEGWQAVDKGEKMREEVKTAADLRNVRGGDLVLRASFLAIVARAFDYCKATGYSLDKMAQKLGNTEWHVLTCSDEELEAKIKAEAIAAETENREPKSFQELLFAHVTADYIRPLIVTKESSFRLTASGPEVATAWSLLQRLHKLPQIEAVAKRAA